MDTVENSMEVFRKELPDLSKATLAPLPINGDYWTPSAEGEKKRVFFKEIRTETVVDQRGDDVELNVAYFVEVVDGKPHVIRQAGIRLTSVFDSFVRSGAITPGMPFEIEYLGKKKAPRTGNMVDHWSITPLATK